MDDKMQRCCYWQHLKKTLGRLRAERRQRFSQEERGMSARAAPAPSPSEGRPGLQRAGPGTGLAALYGLAVPRTALGMLSLLKETLSRKSEASEVSRSQSSADTIKHCVTGGVFLGQKPRSLGHAHPEDRDGVSGQGLGQRIGSRGNTCSALTSCGRTPGPVFQRDGWSSESLDSCPAQRLTAVSRLTAASEVSGSFGRQGAGPAF